MILRPVRTCNCMATFVHQLFLVSHQSATSKVCPRTLLCSIVGRLKERIQVPCAQVLAVEPIWAYLGATQDPVGGASVGARSSCRQAARRQPGARHSWRAGRYAPPPGHTWYSPRRPLVERELHSSRVHDGSCIFNIAELHSLSSPVLWTPLTYSVRPSQFADCWPWQRQTDTPQLLSAIAGTCHKTHIRCHNTDSMLLTTPRVS